MENASHWDYAEVFSGRDAAYLIAGFDPSTLTSEIEYKVQPVVAKLKKSYYLACQNVQNWVEKDGVAVRDEAGVYLHSDMFIQPLPLADELRSIEIEKMFSDYCQSEYFLGARKDEYLPDDWFPESSWVTEEDIARLKISGLEDLMRDKIMWHALGPIFRWTGDYVHEFGDQKFSRTELRRWVVESKIRSSYQFGDTENKHDAPEKPISTTERNTLLVIIAALCQKLDIEPQGRTAASELVRMIDSIGVALDPDTVRDKLRQIPDALSARKK